LYKCVDYKTLPWVYRENLRDFCTPEIIVKAAKAYRPTTDAERKLVEELEPKHVIVDEALLHYGKGTHFSHNYLSDLITVGMGQDNPLDKIKFYSKNKPRGAFIACNYFSIILNPIQYAIMLLQATCLPSSLMSLAKFFSASSLAKPGSSA
jgi:hypothetical protein